MQTTNCVIMVLPTEFSLNPEACEDNHFAEATASFEKATVLREAAQLSSALSDAGVKVIEIDPAALPKPPNAPDGCFPNNWLMFVEGVPPILCPMKAISRRSERAMWPHISERLKSEGYRVEHDLLELSSWEAEENFVEGTGSLVLDRVNRIAFAAISERTTRRAAERVADLINYRLVAFEARDPFDRPIYHTNVLMSIGSRFAMLCPEAIEPSALRQVRELLMESRELIEVTWDQVLQYCGNVLELSTGGGGIVALSKTAHDNFTPHQLDTFRKCGAEPVYADISTIERVAGGSVRCMLAEVFLSR